MQITLLLLSGFLFSVLFGMVIIPRPVVFSGDPDVHVPCDRLPPVLLGYGLIEPVVQHAL